jgi:hypothetical protein
MPANSFAMSAKFQRYRRDQQPGTTPQRHESFLFHRQN